MVSASDGLPLPDRCGLASFNGLYSSSSSATPRSRQLSPVHSPRVAPSHLFSSRRSRSRFPWYQRKRLKVVMALVALLGSLFLVNWIMPARLQRDAPNPPVFKSVAKLSFRSSVSLSVSVQGKGNKSGKGKKPQKGYQRMLALAAHALAEDKREPKDLWQEPLAPASTWRACSDLRNWEPNDGKNGYILVTANGGINQLLVAVCNAVVVARLLNSTLVIPKFMYNSVRRVVSQFGDIYQEEHFINYLTPDIWIVREIPKELQSLDLEAIGSVVTDVDMVKEANLVFT